MNRRDILQSAAGVGLLGIAGAALVAPERVLTEPAPTPDAELVRLCAEFDTTELHFQGLHGEGPMAHLNIEDDKERWVVIDEMDPQRRALFDRILLIRATTQAGIAARARMFALFAVDVMEKPSGWNDEMVGALVRDIIAGAAA